MVIIEENLLKYLFSDGLFDCKESKYIQIATYIEYNSVDMKNILCIHHSCLTAVVFELYIESISFPCSEKLYWEPILWQNDRSVCLR